MHILAEKVVSFYLSLCWIMNHYHTHYIFLLKLYRIDSKASVMTHYAPAKIGKYPGVYPLYIHQFLYCNEIFWSIFLYQVKATFHAAICQEAVLFL